MRGRAQALVATLGVVAIVAGGVVAGRIGVKEPAPTGAGSFATGAWFCPHGGGTGWTTTIEVANPGKLSVSVRLTTFGDGKPAQSPITQIAAGTEHQMPVPASARGSASMVEYFGGWVAAGWVSIAGGGESGIAAEPCLAQAGRTFLLPFGDTLRGDDTYAIVMNPFAEDAVFTLTVYSPDQTPATQKDWTEFVLNPHDSVAFRLDQVALGKPSVAALIQVSMGRVSASSLEVSQGGGVASAEGLPAPIPGQVLLPVGSQAGQGQVSAVNIPQAQASLSAQLFGTDLASPVSGVQGQEVNLESTKSLPVTLVGPGAIQLKSSTGEIAGAFSEAGGGGDFGATSGVSAPAFRWVVLPASGTPPVEPNLLVTNPGTATAHVTLSLLSDQGQVTTPAPTSIDVPPGRTAEVTQGSLLASPYAAVYVQASGAEVVPSLATYSSGQADFALSVGVPLPQAG